MLKNQNQIYNISVYQVKALLFWTISPALPSFLGGLGWEWGGGVGNGGLELTFLRYEFMSASSVTKWAEVLFVFGRLWPVDYTSATLHGVLSEFRRPVWKGNHRRVLPETLQGFCRTYQTGETVFLLWLEFQQVNIVIQSISNLIYRVYLFPLTGT